MNMDQSNRKMNNFKRFINRLKWAFFPRKYPLALESFYLFDYLSVGLTDDYLDKEWSLANYLKKGDYINIKSSSQYLQTYTTVSIVHRVL